AVLAEGKQLVSCGRDGDKSSGEVSPGDFLPGANVQEMALVPVPGSEQFAVGGKGERAEAGKPAQLLAGRHVQQANQAAIIDVGGGERLVVLGKSQVRALPVRAFPQLQSL